MTHNCPSHPRAHHPSTPTGRTIFPHLYSVVSNAFDGTLRLACQYCGHTPTPPRALIDRPVVRIGAAPVPASFYSSPTLPHPRATLPPCDG